MSHLFIYCFVFSFLLIHFSILMIFIELTSRIFLILLRAKLIWEGYSAEVFDLLSLLNCAGLYPVESSSLSFLSGFSSNSQASHLRDSC